MLDSELEKLKIFAGNKPVTKDMVKEICVTNEDLFAFAEFLILENKSKALQEYQKLLTKNIRLKSFQYYTHYCMVKFK